MSRVYIINQIHNTLSYPFPTNFFQINRYSICTTDSAACPSTFAMTLLYQPISRTFGQRDGCLTPTPNSTPNVKNTELAPKPSSTALSSTHEILSPPLSPYQKSSSHDVEDIPALDSKSYLPSQHPFKIENFKCYTLTVNPWSDLHNYKEKQLSFLSKYSFDTPRDVAYSMRLAERRAERRKRVQQLSSDSDSDSVERVRTRRVVKESNGTLPAVEDSGSETPASPKRRKVKKESSYAGSPLAAQQAALIDELIPDYSPDPYTTLPKGNNRALKIEWKGQPMDLRDDPHLDKLHPAEVVLASTLRLRCNVYLDSKRRLFHEKVNRVRTDMPFRRTDAQKACRIDVNKASRLFAAFEKVGWLNDKHFAKYL